LIRQPRLVLCDEPTGNFDQVSVSTVASLLLGLHGTQQEHPDRGDAQRAPGGTVPDSLRDHGWPSATHFLTRRAFASAASTGLASTAHPDE
jgi:hypothetical protein